MGLFLAIVAAAICAAALLWSGRPGLRGGVLLLAAMLAAVAGYAWQGSPWTPGSPTAPRANHPAADPLFARERTVWLGTVGPEADLLSSADMLIASGSPDYAVGVLRGALARTPNDMDLWIGLGNALATYADGQLTPAARFAFARAARIAPRHPGPRYFLGLAQLGQGDLDGAERTWRALLADTPADAPYRALLLARLDTLAQFRALAGAR